VQTVRVRLLHIGRSDEALTGQSSGHTGQSRQSERSEGPKENSLTGWSGMGSPDSLVGTPDEVGRVKLFDSCAKTSLTGWSGEDALDGPV
jgi:hypothetical protein